MPLHERPFDSIDQLHENELEQFRLMFVEGTDLAVTAALDYCYRYGLNVPRWVVLESVRFQCSALRGDLPKKRGRSTGTVNRYLQDRIDLWRWETVIEIRQNREFLRRRIESFSKMNGHTARQWRIDDEKLLRWAQADSFKCASTLLVGCLAFGGPEAVKRSFLKVERNRRSPKTAMRYCILNSGFLRRVGIDLSKPPRVTISDVYLT
jgi:hypothetical protein